MTTSSSLSTPSLLPFSVNLNKPPSLFTNSVPIKLERGNYLLWRSQLLPLLRGYDLEEFITGKSTCPPEWIPAPPPTTEQTTDPNSSTPTAETILNPEFFQWHRQDQLLLSWILSSLSESVLVNVINCTTAHEAWSTLERMYASQSRARIMQLRYQLQTQKKGSLSITDYFQKMKSIADNLAAAAHGVNDQDLILYILAGFGTEYDSFVVSATTRTDPLSLDDLHGFLLTHESRVEQISTMDVSLPQVNLTSQNHRGSFSRSNTQ